MAHNKITLAQLDNRLLERLGGQGRFWSLPERRMAINETIAVWQLLTGEIVKSRTDSYGILSDHLIDQTNMTVPYAGTLRIRCTPNPIQLTIKVANTTTESACDDVPPDYVNSKDVDIDSYAGGSGTLVSYEWRNYANADPTSSYVVVSTDPPVATFNLFDENFIRLAVVDDAGNIGLSSNYLHFCIQVLP